MNEKFRPTTLGYLQHFPAGQLEEIQISQDQLERGRGECPAMSVTILVVRACSKLAPLLKCLGQIFERNDFRWIVGQLEAAHQLLAISRMQRVLLEQLGQRRAFAFGKKGLDHFGQRAVRAKIIETGAAIRDRHRQYAAEAK